MKVRSRKHKPNSWTKIAKERMDILFDEAKARASKNLKRANRYVFLARKIGMRYNVRVSEKHRREFCHHCYAYLLPGKNCKVRTNSKTKCVEYYCQECKKINRFGYSSENAKQ
jgi:ribonuclease P protein subunit RPR2